MVAAAAAAAALFFVLWWMLQGEEHPWVPAGLAASVVMLVAASAREIVLRRMWSRYVFDDAASHAFEQGAREQAANVRRRPSFSQSEALRVLEQKSIEADAGTALPEAHLSVFQLCSEFLDTAEKALASPTISSERRITVRSRQDRVKMLQEHHLLSWARDSARLMTQQAQQQARLHDKIETANRALDCIDTALKSYPNNQELQRSAAAVRDFMTSSRVAHWVELAQRATFKGRYRRAMDCYGDALFYLTRAGGEHELAAEQIAREIELLRARVATEKAVDGPVDGNKRYHRASKES